MKIHKSLSVIVPLYNKEIFIKSTLDNISLLLKDIDYEIIVVENGSTDNSKQVLRSYINSNENLPLVPISSKKGLGNALKAGIKASKKDFIMCIPADFTSGKSEIKFFLTNGDHDYVIGSRTLSSNISRDKNRILVSSVLHIFNKFILNIPIKDTQFTFIIRTNLANQLILNCKSTGFYITAEMIYFALKKNVQILEIPVFLTEDKRNKTTIKFFSDSLNVISDIFRVFINHGRL